MDIFILTLHQFAHDFRFTDAWKWCPTIFSFFFMKKIFKLLKTLQIKNSIVIEIKSKILNNLGDKNTEI